MTPPSPASRRRRRSRRVPWQVPVVVTLLIVVLALLVGKGLNRGPTEPHAAAQGDPLAGEPTSALERADRVTILLLGTDGRDEQDGPPRTDLIMLAVLDRDPARATLISLPRDLWVPIPDYGEGKLNTAYFLGEIEGDGASLARETVEALTGLPIDHTVEIGFDGFQRLIDNLGGIEVEVPETIDDPEYPDENYGTFRLYIPAGAQHFDGETALQYARTRHGSTDIARAERQQRVIMAIRERVLSPSVLPRLPALIRTAHGMTTTDLSLGDLFALARRGRGLSRDEIAMHRIGEDLVTPMLSWNGQDALAYDHDTLQAAIRGWLGDPAPRIRDDLP